jgi:hypothetical protein
MSCALRCEVALPPKLGDPRTNRSRSKRVQCATPLECLTASAAGNVRPGYSFLPTRRRFGEALVTLILGPGLATHRARLSCTKGFSRRQRFAHACTRAGSKLASFSTREGPPRSMRMMMVGASWSMSSALGAGGADPVARVRRTGITEQPAKADKTHPPPSARRGNRAVDAAPERFRVPFPPHGWSVDVPAGPGPADRGRGIRPRERPDPVHAGPPHWPGPHHPRPSRGR